MQTKNDKVQRVWNMLDLNHENAKTKRFLNSHTHIRKELDP